MAAPIAVGSTIWAAVNVGTTAGSWASEADASAYGGYYTWSQARGLDIVITRAGHDPVVNPPKTLGPGTDGSYCPSGWRLPTAQEIADLIGYTGTISGGNLNGPNDEGYSTTYKGVAGWKFYNGLFFPYAGNYGENNLGSQGLYWSSTENDAENAYFLGVASGLLLHYYTKSAYSSVRCVKSAS